MTRFRCIGGDCESSCCTGGWRIGLDREHYEKTKSAMGQSPSLRREFGEKVERVKGVTGGTRQHHALMVLQPDGSCGFFSEQRMCSLQTRFGEGVLSDTCSLYPRSLSLMGARRELAGVSSCPEVTRQLLLHEDAMELDEVPASTFSRSFLHVKIDDHPADPYTRYHDELRNLMFDLLSDTAYPLSSRLSFVAYFANRTVDFLHRGVATLDEPRLMEEVERIQNPAVRAELHQNVSALPEDTAFVSSLVLALVNTGAEARGFKPLLDSVIATYTGQPDQPTQKLPDGPRTAPQLVPAFAAQKQAWSTHAARVDAYLTNYAKNYWAREWYPGSPNLLTHTVQLLLRLATLRFLLFGNPMLASASGLPEPERELVLAKAAVQTVYKFSRSFEHDPSFTRGLQEKLTSSKVISLAHALCLARF